MRITVIKTSHSRNPWRIHIDDEPVPYLRYRTKDEARGCVSEMAERFPLQTDWALWSERELTRLRDFISSQPSYQTRIAVIQSQQPRDYTKAPL